jgi:type II secretory pathway pseudopilin PulG
MFQRGFTLLEAIVSIFIVTVGVGGVFTLVNQTVNSNRVASSRLTALYLAQEGIEIVRHIRDSNFLEVRWGMGGTWDQDLSAGVHYIDYTEEEKNTSNLVIWLGNRYQHFSQSTCPSNPNCQDTSFNRSIEISYPQNYIMAVKSIVTWQERGTTHQATVEENLYKWME